MTVISHKDLIQPFQVDSGRLAVLEVRESQNHIIAGPFAVCDLYSCRVVRCLSAEGNALKAVSQDNDRCTRFFANVAFASLKGIYFPVVY